MRTPRGCASQLLSGYESIADARLWGSESHVSVKLRIAARTLQEVQRFVNTISRQEKLKSIKEILHLPLQTFRHASRCFVPVIMSCGFPQRSRRSSTEESLPFSSKHLASDVCKEFCSERSGDLGQTLQRLHTRWLFRPAISSPS